MTTMISIRLQLLTKVKSIQAFTPRALHNRLESMIASLVIHIHIKEKAVPVRHMLDIPHGPCALGKPQKQRLYHVRHVLKIPRGSHVIKQPQKLLY